MRLHFRRCLAVSYPLIHIALIDAEVKFQEHAFIANEIECRVQTEEEFRLNGPLPSRTRDVLTLLRGVKQELYEAYALPSPK